MWEHQSPLPHLCAARPHNEPEPVHSDGDHSQGGHEGGQTRNRADQSGKKERTQEQSDIIIDDCVKHETVRTTQ